MKFNNKRFLKNDLGTYERALETSNNIYFINFSEDDVFTSVKMFDRKMNLISNDNHAYLSMFFDLDKKIFSWMSIKLKINLENKKNLLYLHSTIKNKK